MRIYEFTSLLEDRSEYIATQMKNNLEAASQADLGRPMDSTEIVAQLKQADPDPQGKNLQFLARMYASRQFKLEDLARIKQSVALFLKNRNQLAVRDLNQLKDLGQLYDLTEPFEKADTPEPVSKRQQEKQVKQDAITLIDTPNFKVVIPKSEAASQLYGKGTKWCTAAENNCQFDSYASSGNLYIIMAKLGGKDRKFQLHLESDAFMNERDLPITPAEKKALSSVPEYSTFLNGLIKKYYGRYLA